MTLPGDQNVPAGFGCEILVIGYGNTLRRDDGVGPKVAEAVAALNLPGVQAITCHQLTPELAGRISGAGTVVFVDATMDTTQSVELLEIQAADEHQLLAHTADPRALLGLANRVFGRSPGGWSLAIRGVDFDFGDDLSPTARGGLEAAVEKIKALCLRLRASAPP